MRGRRVVSPQGTSYRFELSSEQCDRRGEVVKFKEGSNAVTVFEREGTEARSQLRANRSIVAGRCR